MPKNRSDFQDSVQTIPASSTTKPRGKKSNDNTKTERSGRPNLRRKKLRDDLMKKRRQKRKEKRNTKRKRKVISGVAQYLTKRKQEMMISMNIWISCSCELTSDQLFM